MALRIAGAQETEIVILRQIRDQIRSMMEIILLGDPRRSVPAEGKDILDAFVFHDLRKLIDLCLIVVQGRKVHDRLDTVSVLYVLRDLDGAVAVRASTRTKGHADKVRIQFTQNLQRLIDALEFRILLRWKDLEGKALLILFIQVCDLHIFTSFE